MRVPVVTAGIDQRSRVQQLEILQQVGCRSGRGNLRVLSIARIFPGIVELIQIEVQRICQDPRKSRETRGEINIRVNIFTRNTATDWMLYMCGLYVSWSTLF